MYMKTLSKCLFSAVAFFFLMTITGANAQAQDWDKAISLYNQKQYRPALREFHAVLKAHPEYYQAWFYIGSSHFQLQSFEDTIDAFQNYVKANEKSEKDQAVGYYYIGFSNFQLKRYDKAIPDLVKYVSLSEKTQQKVDPSARAALGRCYIYTEKYAEAIPVLNAAAAEMKTNANNFYFLGVAHNKLGKSDLAISSLNQALALNAKDVDSLLLLSDIYLAQSRQNPAAIKQAITTAERLVAAEDTERTWGVLGQAYLADKQFAKAAPILGKYAKAHPTIPAAWFNYGISLSRSNQWKPAAEALEQAAKLSPTNVPVLLELGYVYESDKLADKAMSAYERAFDASGKKDETARQGIERLKQMRAGTQ